MKLKNKKKVALFACVGVLSIMPFMLGNTNSVTVENTDLSDHTFMFHDTLDFYEFLGGMSSETFDVVFTCRVNNEYVVTYNSITFAMDYNANGGSQLLYDVSGNNYQVYNNDNSIAPYGWIDSSYRIITIIGGEDVSNSMLVELLNSSADDITQSVNTMDLFGDVFSFFSDTFFGGEVGMNDGTYLSLICLLLTTLLTLCFVALPLVCIIALIRLFFRY